MSLSSAPTIEARSASDISSGKWGDASSALGTSCRWKETACAKGQAPSVLGDSWRLLCLQASTLSSQGSAAPGSASASVWEMVRAGKC